MALALTPSGDFCLKGKASVLLRPSAADLAGRGYHRMLLRA
jgi:hypothetical protein